MAKFRSEEEKLRILKRIQDGEAKSHVAEDEGVSTSLIYSWLAKYGNTPRVVTYEAQPKIKKQKKFSSRAMLFVGSLTDIMEIAREF